MKIKEAGIIVFLLFAFSFTDVAAQDPKTIRVKKESTLSKAVFDNVDLRLMVIDVYGNPKENKVVSYKLFVKNKKETREFSGFSNSLTADMINYLNKQRKAAKIFFTDVSAIDDHGHLVKLPDVIDTWFPDCKNCEPGNKRRR